MSTQPVDGLKVDVAVIGGGPAGSTAATLLSRAGFRVAVLERERFPREHIGESLLPIAFLALDQMGITDKILQAGFVRKYGATYIWGRSREPWTLRFSEMIDDAFFAFQVRRADFDKILLDHSEACGAAVWEETQVTDVTQLGGRVSGLRWRGPDGTEGKLLSRYILDCSGQSSILGKRFNLREFNEEMRHISLSGYYRGARKLSEVYPDLTLNDDGNLHIVSSAAGWFWHIPLADEISSVGFVTDPSHVRGMNPDQRVEFFLENVAITPELLRLLEPAEWISDRVEMDSDWSFFCQSFHGPGYMLCGDAACFVDPVLSTGIALAMNGAIRAALTLTAVLRQPELEPLGMHWYNSEYRKTAQDFLELALHWYHGERNRDDWFWQARRIVDPSQSFSLQQAFSLIAAGVSRSPGPPATSSSSMPAASVPNSSRSFTRTSSLNSATSSKGNWRTTWSRSGRRETTSRSPSSKCLAACQRGWKACSGSPTCSTTRKTCCARPRWSRSPTATAPRPTSSPSPPPHCCGYWMDPEPASRSWTTPPKPGAPPSASPPPPFARW